MLSHPNPIPALAGIFTGTVLLVSLSGCVPVGSSHRGGFDVGPSTPLQTAVIIVDDYDYYPRYEVYYSRRRNEFVYYDVNAWVRRGNMDLSGITLDMLRAGPSVRVDFHDSPEFHHGRIVQRFPRNWEQSPKPPAKAKAKEETNDQTAEKEKKKRENDRKN